MAVDLPSLRQLSYLVALADRLSFTQAAQACFVTQSTLSAGIRELERTLGAPLIERDRHCVLVTPLGADVVERVAADARPMTGVLRLGAIPTIAPFLMLQLVSRVRARYPALKLALREDQTGALLARLQAAELDFALIALPYETGGLLVRTLFTEELWLLGAQPDAAAGPDLEPPGPRPASVERIDPQRLLLLEEGHCLRAHTLGACGLAERANASDFEATSLVTLVHMVESGLGEALVPQMALDSGLLARAAVRPRRFAQPAPTRTVALVARATSTRRPELEALAELLRRDGP